MNASALRHVYIQLRGGDDPRRMVFFTETISRCGRVRNTGLKPETDATGIWFELTLTTPVRNLVHLRQRLQRVGIVEAQIYSVRAINPGEGRSQAQQLELLRSSS